MKTLVNIFFVSLFSTIAFVASAQTKVAGSRPISKPVQKISNKWLVDEPLVTVASRGYQVQTLSKDVQRISNRFRKEPKPGHMMSVGYPAWTIQKKVHRVAVPVRTWE